MNFRLLAVLYIFASVQRQHPPLQAKLSVVSRTLPLPHKKVIVNSRIHRLSKYSDCSEYLFALSIKSRFQRHMSSAGLTVLDQWLAELKALSNVVPLRFFKDRFLAAVSLPFRLYTVKMSNRNYVFPGPFLRQSEQERLLLKMFSRVIVKRKEEALLDRVFSELRDYLSGQSTSLLIQQREYLIGQGFENRAYVHYRWMLRR